MPPTRREFLGWTAAAATVATASGGAAPTEPIVDSHVHIWDLARIRAPWMKGSGLEQDARWAEYREAAAGLDVAKIVYVEIDVAPADHPLEARLAIELCRDPSNPIAGAVIGGRPADDDFAAYIEPLAKDPAVKGLRQVLHGGTPPGTCVEPSFVRGVRKLGEVGLCFDLCMRHAELADGAKLVESAPETSFVLDHCGNPPIFGDLTAWKKDIDRMAKSPNVVGKVSGLVSQAQGREWSDEDLAPVVLHMLEAFGPDRVLYGSDWPVCTLGAPMTAWAESLRRITADRPEAERRKLWHDNAARVYRLG
ncbi:amidohydrolase family protein [Paludisphaera sp.]|uniref:amidohydrolase family protein n=1 Tax=Paludisphaera sp. TaxID=2017432 RepID=UPI00301D8BD2